LLALHLEDIHAHFEEVKSYLDEVPFCFKKLIFHLEEVHFPSTSKMTQIFCKIVMLKNALKF
jgi:hypothetical protein